MCCCLKDVVFRDVRPIVKYLLVLFTTRMYVTGVSKWYRQSFIVNEDKIILKYASSRLSICQMPRLVFFKLFGMQ